jgi:RNA polymerase sigma factor (TIGR02999 family)
VRIEIRRCGARAIISRLRTGEGVVTIVVLTEACGRATRCARVDQADRVNPLGNDADELLPLVYNELRARAGHLLRGNRPGHTLQRTALVHEAYAKLAGAGRRFESPLHFFNAAAMAMRQILMDHAKGRGRRKRGGARARVNLDDVNLPATDGDDEIDWLDLGEAIDALAKSAPRQAQVVNLRFFAGLGDAEVAKLTGVSEPTVRRDWAAARTWLYARLREASSNQPRA